jgi:hypothetical protein
VIRYVAIEAQLAEPAIRQVQVNLFAQPPLRADAKAIADDQHSHQYSGSIEGRFRLDRRLGCLLKQDEDGAWRPVALGSRALDVLAILADRQGALLSKNEIMAAAWPRLSG